MLYIYNLSPHFKMWWKCQNEEEHIMDIGRIIQKKIILNLMVVNVYKIKDTKEYTIRTSIAGDMSLSPHFQYKKRDKSVYTNTWNLKQTLNEKNRECPFLYCIFFDI